MARLALMDTVAVPAAGTTIGSTFSGLGGMRDLDLEAIFAYGSGGTTAKAYVQTSFDAGATWVDIACFAFATASASKVSSITGELAPASQAFAPSDGALADNTIVQGVLGDQLRVKLVVAGTYAESTITVVAQTH